MEETVDIQTILTLIQAVSESNLTGLELEEGNLRLSLKREHGGNGFEQSLPENRKETESKTVLKEETVIHAESDSWKQDSRKESMIPNSTVSSQEIASDKVVVSPLVGTFYSSPSPEAETFVKVGDKVKKGQVLGIIEAMKLMNEIESEYDGVVEAILVGNEEVVEYGQPLFRIHE